jgi:hypothetical protein
MDLSTHDEGVALTPATLVATGEPSVTMEGVEAGAVSPMTTKDDARAAPVVSVITRMNASRTRTDNNRLPLPSAACFFGIDAAVPALIAL